MPDVTANQRIEFAANMVEFALRRLKKAQEESNQEKRIEAETAAAKFAVNQVVYFGLVLRDCLEKEDVDLETNGEAIIKSRADSVFKDKNFKRIGLSDDTVRAMQAVVDCAKDELPKNVADEASAKHPDEIDITVTCSLLSICGQSVVDKVREGQTGIAVTDGDKADAKNIIHSTLTSDNCIYARWRKESKKGWFSPRSKQTQDIDRVVQEYLAKKTRSTSKKDLTEFQQLSELEAQLIALEKVENAAKAYMEKNKDKADLTKTRAAAVQSLQALFVQERKQLELKIKPLTNRLGDDPDTVVRIKRTPSLVEQHLKDETLSIDDKILNLQNLLRSFEGCHSKLKDTSKLDELLKDIEMKLTDLMQKEQEQQKKEEKKEEKENMPEWLEAAEQYFNESSPEDADSSDLADKRRLVPPVN